MADATTKFESAQALFCSYVDLLGNTKAAKILFGSSGGTGMSKWKTHALTYDTYHAFAGWSTGKKAAPITPARLNKIIIGSLDPKDPEGKKKLKAGDPRLGKQILENRKNIAEAFKRVTTPGMDLKAMEKYLMSNDAWFHSSVIIAMKLISQLHTSKQTLKSGTSGPTSLKKFKRLQDPGIDMDYVRGDKAVMKMIENLFKVAKNNNKVQKEKLTGMATVDFGDVNKWNPGDIYYATDTAIKTLAKEYKKAQQDNTFGFTELNKLTADLMTSGDLLPLSLKKQTDPTQVKIEMVNFGPAYKDQVLADVKFDKLVYTPYIIAKRGKEGRARELPTGNTTTRDLKIYVKDGKGTSIGNIQMRHDPSGTGSWKVDMKFTGAQARAGSVVSAEIFADIWKLVDSTVSETFRDAYNEGATAFVSQVYSDGKRNKKAKGLPTSRKGSVPVKKAVMDKILNGPGPKGFTYFGNGGLAHHVPPHISKELQKANTTKKLNAFKKEQGTDVKYFTKKNKQYDLKSPIEFSNQKRLWQIPFASKEDTYDVEKGRYTSSAYEFQKGEISAITIMNVVGPILNSWFSTASTHKKNSFVRMIFQYVSSRHPSAGKFVIAK
tara:strand:+ start:63 stop:1880 length:1818 start_codon:yes stop_codon:yes gene_type:complete